MINITVALFAVFTTDIIKMVKEQRWEIMLKRAHLLELHAYMRNIRVKHSDRDKLESFLYKKMNKPIEEKEEELIQLLPDKLLADFRLTFDRHILDHLPFLRQLFTADDDPEIPWSIFGRVMAREMRSKYLVRG